jgi:rod shape-determining protein MreD
MKDKINYYIFLPLMFLLFFLQTTFVSQIFGDFFAPNLILIVMIAAVFLSYSANFLYAAVAFGFLFDLFAGLDFGLYMLSFVLAAMTAHSLKLRFLKDETLLRIVAASAAAAISYDAIYLALAFAIFNNNLIYSQGFIWQKMFADTIYAAILVYPAMGLISKRQI